MPLIVSVKLSVTPESKVVAGRERLGYARVVLLEAAIIAGEGISPAGACYCPLRLSRVGVGEAG